MAEIRRHNRPVLRYLMARGQERRLVDHQNPLEKYSAKGVKDRYRFLPDTIMVFVEVFGTKLTRPTDRGHALPVILQICVCLRFLACGSFQIMVGDGDGQSKSSVCRIVKATMNEIIKYMSEIIKFPRGDEATETKKRFFAVAGFPNVIGALDCTQIKIQAPSQFEDVYVCRKSIHSINVQMICDADRIATNLVAKWPGSVHDSGIFKVSSIGRELANQAPHDGFLLGDKVFCFLLRHRCNTHNGRQV
ncbi:putative nuclease HARBI1 [Lineus longissimus]|uniref:putative nuclease HARBI1 n=1 Tax=Lineus longissimus TaxID=88925 RepID=UPI00315C642E